MQIAEWQVDLDAGVLRDGQDTRKLTPKSASVLRYLVERPNELVTSEELLDAFWMGSFSADNAVQKAVSEIRRVFGDDPKDPSYIRTIAKRGYVFIAKAGSPTATEAQLGSPGLSDALGHVRALLKTPTSRSVREARALLDEALAASADSVEALTQSVTVYVHEAAIGEPWWSFAGRATRAAERAMEIDPAAPSVWVAKGLLLQMESRDREALHCYDKACALSSGGLEARARCCKTLYLVGRWPEAMQASEGLLELDPLSPDINMLFAEISIETGHMTEALNYLDRAITLGTDHPDVLLRAGVFEVWSSGDLVRALELYLSAFRADSRDVRAPISIMSIMLMLGLQEEMQHWYGVAASINDQAHGLAYWRAPGADVPYAERRRYVQNLRELQPRERDWLRVSAELEAELAKHFENGARRECLERSYEQYLEFLVRGGELAVDDSGLPTELVVRGQEAHGVLSFLLVAHSLGREAVTTRLWELIADLYRASELHTPRRHIARFMIHAWRGEESLALDYLEAGLEMGFVPAVTYFRLIGLIGDPDGCWHLIDRHPRFLGVLKEQTRRDQLARQGALALLSELSDNSQKENEPRRRAASPKKLSR